MRRSTGLTGEPWTVVIPGDDPLTLGEAIFMGGFLAVFAVLAYVGYRRAKKRRADALAYAKSKGWTYVHEDPSVLLAGAQSSLFSKGDRRTAKNVMQGEYRGRQVTIFDFEYRVVRRDSNGNRRTSTYTHGIIWVAVPEVQWPTLSVSRDGMLARTFASLSNHPDLPTESAVFDKTFYLRCPDPTFALGFINPRAIEILLAEVDQSISSDQRLDIYGGIVELERANRGHDIDRIDRALRTIFRLLDAAPPYLYADYATGRTQAPTHIAPQVRAALAEAEALDDTDAARATAAQDWVIPPDPPSSRADAIATPPDPSLPAATQPVTPPPGSHGQSTRGPVFFERGDLR